MFPLILGPTCHLLFCLLLPYPAVLSYPNLPCPLIMTDANLLLYSPCPALPCISHVTHSVIPLSKMLLNMPLHTHTHTHSRTNVHAHTHTNALTHVLTHSARIRHETHAAHCRRRGTARRHVQSTYLYCTSTCTNTFHADISAELMYILESFPILSFDMFCCVVLCSSILSRAVSSCPVTVTVNLLVTASCIPSFLLAFLTISSPIILDQPLSSPHVPYSCVSSPSPVPYSLTLLLLFPGQVEGRARGQGQGRHRAHTRSHLRRPRHTHGPPQRRGMSSVRLLCLPPYLITLTCLKISHWLSEEKRSVRLQTTTPLFYC